MAAKSERSVNWSEDEKKYLLGLIEAKIDIIECQRVDANVNKRKPMPGRQFMKGISANMGIFVCLVKLKISGTSKC